MDKLIARVAGKKAEFDRLRPLAPGGLRNLEHACDLELTYTSNAIEGNTLTAVETTQVIEHGITIGGKALKDHMEAIDHYQAIGYVRDLARRDTRRLTEFDVRTLQGLVVQRSRPEIAGKYASGARFVNTESGRHHFPSVAEIPALMGDFSAWLGAAPDTPATSFAAHRRLVDIHPFEDGNGRTARLLMNLILLRGGYPPIAVRTVDRPAYIRAIQGAQEEGGTADDFDRLLYERLEAALGEHVSALQEALGAAGQQE